MSVYLLLKREAAAGEAMHTDDTRVCSLSDFWLINANYYVLIKKVRPLHPDRGGRTPAAALTAYARSEDRLKALAAGYHTHVVKPVEPSELAAVVASLAGRTGK